MARDMNRDIKNEVFVAFALLTMLTIALVFALTLASTINGNAISAAATVTSTPSSTPTATSTITPSPSPTTTASPSATHAEATAVSTRPATQTPSTTVTSIPSPTTTSTPSATLTYTPTPSQTPTPTFRPTSELGIVATPTPNLTAIVARSDEILPTRTPATCGRPVGWRLYTIQSGDTLFALAIATGTELSELRDVNCLSDADSIITGDVLFIPRLPDPNRLSAIPQNQRLPADVSVRGCRDVATQITSPIPLQQVNGTFDVYGSANIADFWYYKLEVRADWSDVYNFYLDSKQPITNDLLGQIDAQLFEPGVYWVRLTTVNLGGGITASAQCEIPLLFAE